MLDIRLLYSDSIFTSLVGEEVVQEFLTK
jgi:hypothetical protein